MTGELNPGDKLVTETLAARWNVSPTPLREAYQRLAGEGLIELIPQRGARVATMSLEDALDVYATRQLMEPPALRRSLSNRTPDWEREVREAHERLRVQLGSGDFHDLLAFEDAHDSFHHALLSRCGSRWALRIIRMLQGHSVRYRLQSLEPRGGPSEVLREHDELLACCLRGDIDKAVDRLAQHIQLTIDSIIDLKDPSASVVSHPRGLT